MNVEDLKKALESRRLILLGQIQELDNILRALNEGEKKDESG